MRYHIVLTPNQDQDLDAVGGLPITEDNTAVRMQTHRNAFGRRVEHLLPQLTRHGIQPLQTHIPSHGMMLTVEGAPENIWACMQSLSQRDASIVGPASEEEDLVQPQINGHASLHILRPDKITPSLLEEESPSIEEPVAQSA